MTLTEKLMFGTLQAIEARIRGEWDHPELIKWGLLAVDPEDDILVEVEKVLWRIETAHPEWFK
jgi:hypothetical protein